MHASWRFMLDSQEPEAPDLSYGTIVAMPARKEVESVLADMGRSDMVETFRRSSIGQVLYVNARSVVQRAVRLSSFEIAEGVATNLDALNALFVDPDNTARRRMALCSQSPDSTLLTVLKVWDDGTDKPTPMVRRAYLGAYMFRHNREKSRSDALETFDTLDLDFRSMTDALLSSGSNLTAFGTTSIMVAQMVARSIERAGCDLPAIERAQWLISAHSVIEPLMYGDLRNMEITKKQTEVRAAFLNGMTAAMSAGCPASVFMGYYKAGIAPEHIEAMYTQDIDIDLAKEIAGAA
jgi:hypothetical protein